MLNNETWLAHSDLFKKHWIIETKPWARTLGWFSNFQQTVSDSGGWAQAGQQELAIGEYINFLEEEGSERKLYRYLDGKWEHVTGPLILVYRKSKDEVFVVGWAGNRDDIERCKEHSNNVWDWPEITIVEVDPLAAIHTLKVNREHHKDVPVFFTSNGETNAEENWKHLQNMCPRAVRIDKVDGRRNMFLRAVDLSEGASHFFVVTGKNKVTDLTVFDYPVKDAPRAHIVFNAKNMSNRLEYGHMGVVAYNVDLVLNTPENFGLDFTSYSPIYTVPRTVSEATFATTKFEAWRTAFRETVKLTLRDTTNDQFWLARWTAFAEGENSDWVLKGAKDGYEYAQQHLESPVDLRNTVDWNWLQRYYASLYSK